jgi:hypothetical protein
MPAPNHTVRIPIFEGASGLHLEERPAPEPAAGEARVCAEGVAIDGNGLQGRLGEDHG